MPTSFCSRRQALAGLFLTATGCDLFRSLGDGKSPLTTMLPPLDKPLDRSSTPSATLRMARLEACIASRPINDHKTRKLVWEELDESGLMAPEQRQRLNESGFRLGVAGSSTPWAVQSLAQDASRPTATDGTSASPPAPAQNLSGAFGTIFTLLPGGQSYLEIQSDLDESRLPLQQIAQLSMLRNPSQIRCVLELSVRELSADWVLLNVLPIVYSGSSTARLTIEQNADKLPIRQNMLPLYEQQLQFRLLAGEIAVLGRNAAEDPATWTLGHLFFQPYSDPGSTERILMVRMNSIETLQGRSDPGFRPGPYAAGKI